MSALISTSELNRRLGSPGLRILDASWHMPSEKRDAYAEYEVEHIPGTVFFDIDKVCDKTSPYPHMLPSAEDFAAAVGKLGVSKTDEIVIYDANGLFSAARVWWMFRIFGHDNVKVLDGGLPKWKAEGLKLEKGSRTPAPATFSARFLPALLRDKKQVQSNITAKRELILDARSPGRFSGKETEPRPGLRSGHIEGSVNLYFRDVLTPPYNTLKAPEELRQVFATRNIDPGHPVAVTCGSGVTACILALALYELGNERVAVYDGAWAEWGSEAPPGH